MGTNMRYPSSFTFLILFFLSLIKIYSSTLVVDQGYLLHGNDDAKGTNSTLTEDENIEIALNNSLSEIVVAVNNVFDGLDDPMGIDESNYDTTGQVCLAKYAFGCLCYGSIGFQLSLNDVSGLDAIRYDNNTATMSDIVLQMNEDRGPMSGSVSFQLNNASGVLEISGTVDGTASACGYAVNDSVNLSAKGKITISTSVSGEVKGCGRTPRQRRRRFREIVMTNVTMDVVGLELSDFEVGNFPWPFSGIMFGVEDLMKLLSPSISLDIARDLLAGSQYAFENNIVTTECVDSN
mmetsp:Transcript_11341/g.12946  ORF Transcript_11341/g.12946 Transcript_11341/m.12946 type:complete len:293 (+) Transcript_11341:32-910(+)